MPTADPLLDKQILAFKEGEKGLWDIFLKQSAALEGKIIEVPTSDSLVSTKNNSHKQLVIRSTIVTKDETIYNEYLENPGVWPRLMIRANQALAEENQ